MEWFVDCSSLFSTRRTCTCSSSSDFSWSLHTQEGQPTVMKPPWVYSVYWCACTRPRTSTSEGREGTGQEGIPVWDSQLPAGAVQLCLELIHQRRVHCRSTYTTNSDTGSGQPRLFSEREEREGTQPRRVTALETCISLVVTLRRDSHSGGASGSTEGRIHSGA